MSQMRGPGINSGALEVKQVIKRSHLRAKDLMKQPKAIRYVFKLVQTMFQIPASTLSE